MPLQYRSADLAIYPQIMSHLYTHISLGDLHGNALKLIYILIEEGLIHLDPQQYEILRRIYNTLLNQLTAKDLSEFEHIIHNLKINKERAITLIGDELADRGQNDYFTLLVLKRLHEEGASINIMVSNHSVEFIRDYEKKNFTGNYHLLAGQGESLKSMQTLIARQLINENEVREIVDNCYKSMVKAISYTLFPEGELTLFSHAPIGLETVKALAEKFNIPYRDNSIRHLIHTIDEINKVVQHLFDEKKLAQVIEAESYSAMEFPISLRQPLRRLTWNRALGNELVTEPTGRFKVKFVHGHVGPESILKNDSEFLPNHENLDSLFGKSFGLSKTSVTVKHFTRQSSEMTEKELTEQRIQEISRKFDET